MSSIIHLFNGTKQNLIVFFSAPFVCVCASATFVESARIVFVRSEVDFRWQRYVHNVTITQMSRVKPCGCAILACIFLLFLSFCFIFHYDSASFFSVRKVSILFFSYSIIYSRVSSQCIDISVYVYVSNGSTDGKNRRIQMNAEFDTFAKIYSFAF